MPNIKVNEFINASRTYVQKNVQAANVDGNPYLTRAEAKKLPRDLRDNFEHHRVGGQDNGRVSVKKFQENFVAYVAVQARRADKNGDGILSARDMTRLPKDLRDNVANYVEATRGQHTLKTPAILRERVLEAVNGKDWKGFIELCDPENVKGQKQLGVNQYQYVAEALGLNTVNNALPGDVSRKSTLDQIEKLTLQRAGSPGSAGDVLLKGSVTLKNGDKLQVTLYGQERPDGTFWLTPPVG